MKPAIRVDNLSKLYHIGAKQNGGYRTLRESLVDAAAAPFRRLRNAFSPPPSSLPPHPSSQDFWALKDVSFEVQPGDVVGIMGRNGAGKSTLLKILSRITEPTAGRIEISGRMGSLLEVGTGFHPELTGRENIFLNGAILGMTRQEILQRFDEIVAFADVEQFLDTPVKRYSSGMYVRLAFAVAAHMHLEILVVDEVLAVGDMAFQKKCLGKMQEVSRSGRTVLFVSHNMGTMERICNRCLVLEAGEIKFHGEIQAGIGKYEAELAPQGKRNLSSWKNRTGTGETQIIGLSLLDNKDEVVSRVKMGEKIRFSLHVKCKKTVHRPRVWVTVNTTGGQRLFRLLTSDQGVELSALNGEAMIVSEVPSMPLLPGIYVVSAGIADGIHGDLDVIEGAMVFEVIAADVFGTGQIPQGRGDLIFISSKWELQNYRN